MHGVVKHEQHFICIHCGRQLVRPRHWRVHEPGLDYEVESDEDWSEPEDGESLTVSCSLNLLSCYLHKYCLRPSQKC